MTQRAGATESSDRPADTRERIIEIARGHFAELGYEATSNRIIARDAGITTGAIYYYFESKLDMYRDVFAAVQKVVYDAFTEAEAASDALEGKLRAVLETAHELNRCDPSIAKFLATSRIEGRRLPDLAAGVGAGDPRRERFFERMIDDAVARGELRPDYRASVTQLVRAFIIGLVDGMSDDLDQHRTAIEGLLLAIHHLTTPQPSVAAQ